MNSDNQKIDIAALAKLSRVEVSMDEMAKLARELPSIVAFVETIQKADVSQAQTDTSLRNVMREDQNPIAAGTYTETLLSAAPTRVGDHVAVKQVVSRAEIFKKRSDYENPSAVSKKAAEKK